ncbi:hypothetical protein AB0F46_25605 [Streptomyces sp. NPDC026665]|uniref:hypothetical protein n=1 Tax=Streptomyces sp. NPDC026665 TaxID=3154798 RepID=UPI0033DFC2FD
MQDAQVLAGQFALVAAVRAERLLCFLELRVRVEEMVAEHFETKWSSCEPRSAT